MKEQLARRTFLRLSGAGSAALWFAARGWAWSDEPAQAPLGKKLVVRTEQPYNAEAPLEKLPESFLTPHEHFYVRSNGTVPRIDPKVYLLRVEGLVHRPLTISLAQLAERFKPRTAAATLMCAGNRRREHSLLRKAGGVQWDAGPLGTAEWNGAALSELLRAAEIREGARHVWFESLDEVVEEGKTFHFGASIPLEKALAEEEGVPGAILAHGMGGRPLPVEHGFPLRVVAPGYIGSRSVKWLGKIVVSDRPSDNYFIDRSYKLVERGDAAELAAAAPLYEFPINAAICVPAEGAEIKAGRVRVAGYALPPGIAGRTIAKVEVSADGGKTWSAAELGENSKSYCWRLWRKELTLSPGEFVLLARAIDSSGQIQPEKARLNQKGYLYNGWHKLNVRAV